MRTLLALVLALLCGTMEAAIFQQSFTTNSNGKTPNILATSTNVLYPLMVLNPDGSGTDRSILFNSAMTITGTNTSLGGDLFVTNIYTTVVNATTVKINGKNASVTSVNGTNITPLNLTNTATVTWAYDGISNVTAAASGSGDTTATNIVTVTQTGTNASQLDFSLVARGGVFKITATNNLYFGAPANVNNTDFKKAFLVVQQPSTGTCAVTFTNGFYQFPEGIAPIIDTNNSAVTIYQFISDPITNGLLHGWMSLKSKLIP